jgi:hypothetical protein
MKKTILSFTAMCCISINPGDRLNQEENQARKPDFARTAQETALWELAMASIIREEDIQEVTGSFNQKLLDKPSCLSGTGRSKPAARGESPLLLLAHDFWLFILTGVNKDQAFSVTRQLAPPDHVADWLALFNATIEEHFSGTMGHVARDKVMKYIDSFLDRLLLLSH